MTIKERCVALRGAFPDASDPTLARIVGCCYQTLAYHTKPEHHTRRRKWYNIHQKKKTAESKRKLIQLFGGCCVKCGYHGCDAAMDFHHIDPTQKHRSLSVLMKGNFDKAVEEAKKCELLCCRCHRELHEKENDLSEIRTRFSDIGEVGVAGAAFTAPA